MHGELLARVLERDNLQRALKQVRRNKGAPGIDDMSVDELPEYSNATGWTSMSSARLGGPWWWPPGARWRDTHVQPFAQLKRYTSANTLATLAATKGTH